MAVLTIGTTEVSPSSLTVSVMDISKAERNALGTMIIERITTKRKLELSWSYLTAAQLQAIMGALSPVTFSVTYTDPVTNTSKTGTFYAGDRNVGMVDFQNGVPRYKEMRVSLVEV
ncbi:DUF6711 family protein [Paenibacillus sedimenti]|uniref:Uncharacterized protein n=1 Tax=Paenibacillus sedimenti TaxID=2770274 RepID=A0A926QJ26_9BACL|nr:DUF6711 family protein [Paenibacillus sedimenti]MBD0381281.1 hypothetical protein [Paenibacillus sedimenti]